MSCAPRTSPSRLFMGTQSAGVTAWYTADLTPGTYVAVCFIPDPVKGIPHVMYGMTQIIEVE